MNEQNITTKKYRILSLDGGGIRGVISARILQEIEISLKKYNKGKNQKLHGYFDLIAGTSTGSILAAGIACQMSAKKLIDLYKIDGVNIFLKNFYRQRQSHRPSYWLRKLFGNYALYPHKSKDQGLANVLKRNLKIDGKSTKIKDIDSLDLLILAYDVYSRNTTWFTNSPPNNLWYKELELWEICTASASAPTFFPPYKLDNPAYQEDKNKPKNFPHIDGGVSSNNPTLSAISHALLTSPKVSTLSDIEVLSIGTGKTTNPYDYETLKKWGLLNWIQHIPDIFMDPSAENSQVIFRQIIKGAGGTHLRLNFDLNKGIDKGDKSQKNRLEKIREIDNVDICEELIKVTESYLTHGKVDWQDHNVGNEEAMEVREAIEKFVNPDVKD